MTLSPLSVTLLFLFIIPVFCIILMYKYKITAKEKLQTKQLAQEIKSLFNSIDMNIIFINEMLNKTEPHIFKDKTLISLINSEHEALYEMLNSLKVMSVHRIKAVEHILFLLKKR